MAVKNSAVIEHIEEKNIIAETGGGGTIENNKKKNKKNNNNSCIRKCLEVRRDFCEDEETATEKKNDENKKIVKEKAIIVPYTDKRNMMLVYKNLAKIKINRKTITKREDIQHTNLNYYTDGTAGNHNIGNEKNESGTAVAQYLEEKLKNNNKKETQHI